MRFIVGIDLGTTNSAVSFVDMESSRKPIQQFRIPQVVAPHHLEARDVLPSYCYLPSGKEWCGGELDLPWSKGNSFAVGAFALSYGSKVPTQLVSSAKSWLCHHAANRKDKILPFDAADEESRISPVEATSRYLDHIRRAWNFEMARGEPELELEQQEVILTVPASFDEVARALTAEAAKMAGFQQIAFLEEPQAAFYCWIAHNDSLWDRKLHPNAKVLVCDIGGGTTDFSLIEVMEKGESLSFKRTSVGDHLLLGGDNLDMALAYYLEEKMRMRGEADLTSPQWKQLYHEARRAKEKLLLGEAEAQYKVTIQGSGSSVIQGARTIDLSSIETTHVLLEGFFPKLPWNEAAAIRKSSGMRTMGLPYEDDPCITKQLAHFLQASCRRDQGEGPDFILFNGGTMKAPSFQERIMESLRAWYPDRTIVKLESPSLDLAVSRGAAYFGKARKGLGVKISGGSARSYYLELHLDREGSLKRKVICLLPRGCDEETSYTPEASFELTPNVPVSFAIWTSHVRLDDRQGDMIDIDPQQFHALPPIHTILRFGKKQTESHASIPVALKITYTAIGTLDLWLHSQKSNHSWKLEFQLKSASGHEDQLAAIAGSRQDETYDASHLQEAASILEAAFTKGGTLKPDMAMNTLEEALSQQRGEWSISLLRGLWDTLIKYSAARKISPAHEARWWNLSGYFLRPGFGHPLDEFRIKELWKLILADQAAQLSDEVRVQQWICFRRIAGGLKKGQQVQLAALLLPAFSDKKSKKMDLKNKAERYHYSEKLRAFAALELVDNPTKIKVGTNILDKIKDGTGSAADFWALGRLGARQLAYGTPANVLPSEIAASWAEGLIARKPLSSTDNEIFALGQLAAEVEQRELNVARELRDKILTLYRNTAHYDALTSAMTYRHHRSKEEEERIFGDRLPPGLIYRPD